MEQNPQHAFPKFQQRPRVLVVQADFYPEICAALLEGAKAYCARAGMDVEVACVPGALEIPPAIALAHHVRQVYDGYIALGCVIRGETTHYDLVAEQSARGLMDLALRHGLAIGNGILTVENEQQALARAQRARLDKGGGAAAACAALLALKYQWGDGA